MRRIAALGTVALVLAVGAGRVAAAPPSSGFLGSWTSTDPVDGSTQHLRIIGSNGHVQMMYVDEYATTCANIGASTNVFTGVLTGTISGDELFGWWKSAGCGSRLVLRASDRFGWFFVYDSGTDTLFGAINDGPATWHRD